jgi:hypothetical protein
MLLLRATQRDRGNYLTCGLPRTLPCVSTSDRCNGRPVRFRVELAQILADGDVALAHGTVLGTATGRLYGAPATRRSFEASF